MKEMDCSWYISRDSKDSEFEGFFMHFDTWSQYDSNSDDRRPFLSLFIEDYQKISACKIKPLTI